MTKNYTIDETAIMAKLSKTLPGVKGKSLPGLPGLSGTDKESKTFGESQNLITSFAAIGYKIVRLAEASNETVQNNRLAAERLEDLRTLYKIRRLNLYSAYSEQTAMAFSRYTANISNITGKYISATTGSPGSTEAKLIFRSDNSASTYNSLSTRESKFNEGEQI